MNTVAGTLLLIVSMVIVGTNMPGDAGEIALPSLYAVVGLEFACGFILGQYAFVFWLRSRRGIILVSVLLVAGTTWRRCPASRS